MPRAKRDFVRTNIYIGRTQTEIMKKLAYMSNTSVAEVTRKAIDKYINEEVEAITAAFNHRQKELTASVGASNIGG